MRIILNESTIWSSWYWWPYLINKFSKFKPALFTVSEDDYERIGPHAFAVIVADAGFSRDELVDYLKENGIDSRNLFLSMPTQCPGFEFLGHSLGEFPEAEYIGNNGLHIGVHQNLGKKECDYFISIVEQLLSKHAKAKTTF